MILVTGGSGQVATELAQRAGDRVVRVGRPEFDFDRPETIEAVFHRVQPHLVVNAAAWTAVDAAETNEDAAQRANRDGPAHLARLCAAAGIPMIHISTDYVFDGAKGAPYGETDLTCPTGVYGSSKLAGEQAVSAACPQAVILRTSWVYAAVGKNFVRTMLGAALKTPTLRVVADQRGCPTNAGDLAEAILVIVAVLDRTGWRDEYRGIYHATNAGETTWHGFASRIFAEAAGLGLPPPEVVPLATADWPTPTKRPADSRLDNGKLERVFGVRLPPWERAVGPIVRELMQTGGGR